MIFHYNKITVHTNYITLNSFINSKISKYETYLRLFLIKNLNVLISKVYILKYFIFATNYRIRRCLAP